jgi:hypothetical protein
MLSLVDNGRRRNRAGEHIPGPSFVLLLFLTLLCFLHDLLDLLAELRGHLKQCSQKDEVAADSFLDVPGCYPMNGLST